MSNILAKNKVVYVDGNFLPLFSALQHTEVDCLKNSQSIKSHASRDLSISVKIIIIIIIFLDKNNDISPLSMTF